VKTVEDQNWCTSNVHHNSNDLYNGMLGLVLEYDDESIVVKFDNLEINSTTKRMEFKLLDSGSSRKQFPLILAYAVTVQKCQGLTLALVEVDLENSFDFGQIYVAVSRAVSAEKLIIRNCQYLAVTLDRRIRVIVISHREEEKPLNQN
jgi:ATP-dependent exoDNAse (exonuclease V) alpha subunit